MTPTLVAILVCLLCWVVLPTVLHDSTVFDRRPHSGLAVWGVMCFVGWTSALATFLRVGVGDANLPLVRAVVRFARGLGDGHPLRGLGLAEVVGLSLAFDLLVLIFGALVVAAWRVMALRTGQRTVLDLVAETPDHLGGVQVLHHSYPLAYFVPGGGGRVVVSTGAMALLTRAELDAVIDHELGHRNGRHGAVLIPLQALSSFVPFLPIARFAPATMRAYLEMTADDFSRARGGSEALRSALAKAKWFPPAPAGSLSSFDDVIGRRRDRLAMASASRSDAAVVLVTVALSIWVLWYIVGVH